MYQKITTYRAAFGRASILSVGSNFVTHAHEHAQIMFCLEGTAGKMTIGGKTAHFGQDNFVVINPYEPHSHIFHKPGGVFLLFYLDRQFIQQRGKGVGQNNLFSKPMVTLTPSLRSGAHQIFWNLINLDGGGHLLDYEIIRFIDKMIEVAADGELPAEEPRAARDYRVRRAIQIMKSNVGERICFEELARSVGLSRPHFFSLFRDQMNVTPNVFWNALRAEEAARQLEQSDESLINIAYNLGFSTHGNFSRFFRDHVGVAPLNYRSASRDWTGRAAGSIFQSETRNADSSCLAH